RKVMMGSNVYIVPRSECETYRSLRCISAMVFIYNLKRRHINKWKLKSYHLMLHSSFLQYDRKKSFCIVKDQRIETKVNNVVSNSRYRLGTLTMSKKSLRKSSWVALDWLPQSRTLSIFLTATSCIPTSAYHLSR